MIEIIRLSYEAPSFPFFTKFKKGHSDKWGHYKKARKIRLFSICFKFFLLIELKLLTLM